MSSRAPVTTLILNLIRDQIPGVLACLDACSESTHHNLHASPCACAHPLTHPQLADWLEAYAHSMELNVWTSATVTSVKYDLSAVGKTQGKGAWTITIKRGDGKERTFKPNHVVFAHGFGGGVPKMPSIPGMVRPLPLVASVVNGLHTSLCRRNSRARSSTLRSTRAHEIMLEKRWWW